MIYRKALDIDLTSKWSRFRPKDNEFLNRMIDKILMCKHLVKLEKTPSSFKGFHLILFCNKDCDICRLCYDDTRHLAYDMNRPEWARNILFQSKEKIKIEV